MPATPAWPPRSAPRLFVPQPIETGAQIVLEGGQAHYLVAVMRAAPGDALVLCDDATGEWACRIVAAGKRRVDVDAVERLRPREDVPDLWLAPVLLKKDRFDLVLEKATELGVAEIRPLVSRRAVATKLNAERARSILVEAAEQCARTALPRLHAPVSLDRMLSDWPADRALFFADELGGAPAATAYASHARAAILTGPEGGFDDAERTAIRALPEAIPISLGPRILRGETAAIAAIATWMAVAGDWNATSHKSLAHTQAAT